MARAAPTRLGAFTYPRLRPFTPVLRRTPDTVQVGLEGAAALMVLSTEPVERVLELLDGRHHLSEVHRCAAGLEITADRVDSWLRYLADAGLVSDAAQPDLVTRPLTGCQIRLVGAGHLGRPVAEALLAAGVSLLHVTDEGPVDPLLYPTAGAAATMADALRGTLSDWSDEVVRVTNHWSKPEHVKQDLTVLACDAPEPDRVITDHLMRTDQPHLLLRSLGAGAVVGPLVIPGETACLRCTDLTRRSRDRDWPLLMTRLSRVAIPPPPIAAAWGASTAATQIVAHLQGFAAQTRNATLEISAPDYQLRVRTWPQHPGCGCAWQVTAE